MFYTILEFLVTPQGLATIFLILFIAPLFVYFLEKKKRYATLKEYFNAYFSWTNGLCFDFSGERFYFSDQGQSVGSQGYGGIARQPIVWTYTQPCFSFFCATPSIKKYQFTWNLGSCPYEKIITISGNDILIGSETEYFLELIIKSISKNNEVAQSLSDLIKNKGSYLRVSEEYIIGRGSLISNKNILRYYIVDTEVYSNPFALEQSLKNICTVLQGFGVKIEKVSK